MGPPVLVLLSGSPGLGSETPTLDRTGKQMASALFSFRSSNTALVSSNEQMESWHLKPGWPWIICPGPSLYRGETGAQVTRMRETPWIGKTNGSSPLERGRSQGPKPRLVREAQSRPGWRQLLQAAGWRGCSLCARSRAGKGLLHLPSGYRAPAQLARQGEGRRGFHTLPVGRVWLDTASMDAARSFASWQ